MVHSLEGMSLVGLLHGLQHVLVDAEGDGGGQRQQRAVGRHRHHGAAGQRHQQRQPRAQRRARPGRRPPVDQRLHCNRTRAYLSSAIYCHDDSFDLMGRTALVILPGDA